MEEDIAKIEEEFTFHTKRVLSVAFSPNSSILCSAGGDKKVVLTSLENYKNQKVLKGHTCDVWGSSFSNDGNLLGTCSNDKTIRIWDISKFKNQNKSKIVLKGHTQCVFSVEFFRQNEPNRIVSVSSDKTIKIWDFERKQEISTLKDCVGAIYCVDILPDNNTIVTGEHSSRNNMRFFDLRSGKCVKILDYHENTVRSVHFHPNSFSLASGGYECKIKIIDYRTFQLVQSYENHSNLIESVHIHPSGKYLASGSRDKTIRIIDLEEKKLLSTLDDHTNWTQSVKFSPDGMYFASGSSDKKVFLWNFPPGGSVSLNKTGEEEERLSKILSDKDVFPSFPVKLSNKTVEIWKSLVVSSQKFPLPVPNELTNLSLSIIGEENMLKLLTGLPQERIEVPFEDLGDHFVFFRELGMKYETKFVVDKVLQIKKLEECFEIFSSFCKKHENPKIKGWFSKDDKCDEGSIIENLDETSFDTSFALQVFIRIKQLHRDQSQPVSKVFLFRNFGTVHFHVSLVGSKVLSILEHPDFKGLEGTYELDTKMKTLRNGINSNLTVITTDSKEFLVHKEILAFKSNFFSRMFNFNGRERQQILEEGSVRLDSIDSKALEIILDLIYFKKIDEGQNRSKSLEILIPLLVHFHMYQETFMFNQLLSYFLWVVPNPGNLKEILEKEGVGSLLFENTKLMRKLIPVLSKIDPNLTKQSVEEYVLTSYRNSVAKVSDLEDFNKMKDEEIVTLKEENRELRERNKELEEEILELRSTVQPVLGGRRRKRGNDEEEVEKEKPKKKRKVERRYNLRK